jgi:predicted metal-dependent enzyme (double-stranded beta helix superfamily)
MAYGLDDFCVDCRDALKADGGDGGREKIRQNLEKLLENEDFVAENCGPDAEVGVHTLYHDEELDFHVLAHIYADGKQSPPHDHGHSWAVYGQAILHTEMIVWDRKDDQTEVGKADLAVARQFRLDPGMAGVFQPGDVHSIKFPDGARFVRITGTDLKQVRQKVFNLDEGTVKISDPMQRAS